MSDQELLFDGVLDWCLGCIDFRKTCRGVDHPALCPRIALDGEGGPDE